MFNTVYPSIYTPSTVHTRLTQSTFNQLLTHLLRHAIDSTLSGFKDRLEPL